jgi:protein tyrosine/serine phosphatase
MSAPDLTTPSGRFKAYLSYFWEDHAFLRTAFANAHWIGPDMVRTNQPSPGQLAYWQRQGIKTVINLRGERNEAFYWLERDACQRLGLTLIDAPLDSRDAPDMARVRRAKALFEQIDYPVLIHCKSGADRAGLMAVLYRHLHLGEPVSQTLGELGKRTLHCREGLTGVLDYMLELYVKEGEARGLGLLEWMEQPDYDPVAIREAFRSQWWGRVLVDRLLRRE